MHDCCSLSVEDDVYYQWYLKMQVAQRMNRQ